MDLEFQNTNELNQVETNSMENLTLEHQSLSSAWAPLVGYGVYRISHMPEVRNAVSEKINDCKEWAKEAFTDAKEAVTEFGTNLYNGIKDYCCGIYENVKEFLDAKEKPNPNAYQWPETAQLNEGITEGREFGLDKCTEAALEIFNPGVISEWGNMTQEERKGIALMYAEEVAKAFELEFYNGVIIEKMEPGTFGSNNGDGYIHLSDVLIDARTSPFEIMNTITHELRHQYQHECVLGYHDVTDEVRNEWGVATLIYNYDYPSCYDPWGYVYNPLEIDSRYAGETVVRNVSSQMFNDLIANA